MLLHVCAGPVPMRQRSLPAVSMLPQWKQLHCDPPHLCLLPAARSRHRLHHVDAGHGDPAEEGMSATVVPQEGGSSLTPWPDRVKCELW